MKANAIIRIVLYSILALVLTGILLVGLGIDAFQLDIHSGTAVTGEASIDAIEIEDLEIEWAAGSVTIRTAETDKITISESGTHTQKYSMVYELDGDTLRIRYSASGLSVGIGSLPSKDLTVTVPENWVCGKLELDAAAVEVTASLFSAEAIELDGAAMDFTYTGQFAALECDGASCKVTLNCTGRPDAISIDGASCVLNLVLPQGCGFRSDLNGLACDLFTELPYTIRYGIGTYGDGHTQITVEGMACQVYIEENTSCSHRWRQDGAPSADTVSYSCTECGAARTEILRAPEADLYDEAEALLSRGEIAAAAIAFGRITSYEDAWMRSQELWATLIKNQTIALSMRHSLAITESGAVLCAGDPYLETDGGAMEYQSVTEAAAWTDIISIDAESQQVMGLHADGTVSALSDSSFHPDTTDWTDITAIAAGFYHMVGLRSDGTVVVVASDPNLFSKVAGWTDIVAIDASGNVTVGLKADGTVVAAGNNAYGQCDVKDLRDILQVRCAPFYTAYLRTDGTVGCTNTGYHSVVSTWTDIVEIFATDIGPVGLKSDGSLVWANESLDFLSQWHNITALRYDSQFAIGLCADGTVLVHGIGRTGKENAAAWTQIKQAASR